MNIEKKTTEKITWDIDLCEAEASIVYENGRIISQVVSINKTVEASREKNFSSFWSDDIQFIKDVHKALGDYIQNVEGITRGVTHKIAEVIE